MTRVRAILLLAAIAVTLGAPAIKDKSTFEAVSSLLRGSNLIEDDWPPISNKFKDISNNKESHKKRVKIRHPGVINDSYDRKKIVEDFKAWSPNDESNLWELSGHFEGDIMLDPKSTHRNGILDETLLWPLGVIPYEIHKEDFDDEQLDVINKAIDELNEKTCLIFRPASEYDTDAVVVKGDESGCWSYVGRQGYGQVLNLMVPGCVKHGIVIHEFVHSIGFYHQQSSSDRDDYVTIHWDNIIERHKHNFNKYDNDTVSNYKVGYDYNSLMHYGPKAFAKDKTLNTITPKAQNVTIGQRVGLSMKDVSKIKIMYKDECIARKLMENVVDMFEQGY